MSQPVSSSRARSSFGDEAEAQHFVEMLERFERGQVSADEYRQFRLTRGVYGQRQEGLQMVRVKIPQGVLDGAQLRALADCAEKWSRGYGHLTTRQNVQFHMVKVDDAPKMLEAFAKVGLTTREACSHTVRNVVGCPYAGVCGGAPFDVTPYAEAVTRHFLRGRWGSGLPRKFKINASGCDDDCARSAMNDIGFIAQLKDGARGFRFLVGGGTSTLARSGRPLFDFLPAEELLAACEAVVRVFNREGERKNLRKARLKWAIERLGWEAFAQAVHQELELIRAEGGRPLPPVPPAEGPPPVPQAPPPDGRPLPDAFRAWARASTRPQAQAGYTAATAWLRLGDVSGRQLVALAALAERWGDGTVRTTLQQNFLFRWIRNEHLPALWQGLHELGLGEPFADTISDVTSCPGAETCRIAVTASRGMAQLLNDHLQAKSAELGPAGKADIKISGCPNGCGQHHVAAIGLQGGVRRVGKRLVPQYHVMLGGTVDGRGATFGRLVARIPARRVSVAVDRLIAWYEKARHPDERPHAFFTRVDAAAARDLLADLEPLDAASASPDDFIDLGSTVEFEVIALDGECAQ